MYTIGYGVDETSYRIGCAVFKTSFLELTYNETNDKLPVTV